MRIDTMIWNHRINNAFQNLGYYGLNKDFKISK